MTTFISVLRGINVGGHNKVLMNDLKALYESFGWKNVTTYIQSGNVIFQTNEEISTSKVAEKIKNAIFRKYGFEVPVIVRTLEEMNRTVKMNPFLNEKNVDEEKLHVTLLSELPAKDLALAVSENDFLPDRFVIKGKDIYLFCPNGYGNTKISNNFFEKKLKVIATTRNWKTIKKLTFAPFD